MIELVSECNDLMKYSDFPYAFCGGYAIEMFLNKKLRTHSDIDLTIFEEYRINTVDFLLNRNWNVYERINGSLTGQLRLITNSSDEKITNLHNVWVLKHDCSFFKLESEPNIENVYNYEIISHEQLKFDFIEIMFNKQKDGNFVIDSFSAQGKDITRSIDKAILYKGENIPYLAPEIIQLFTAHPAYAESDYHKTKSYIDFNAVAPFLPKESRNWLISALETAYPTGNKRTEQLKALNSTL